MEARKIGESQPATPASVDLDLPIDPIPSLTARRLTHLPPDTRPLPSVAQYDQLLRRNRPQEGTTS